MTGGDREFNSCRSTISTNTGKDKTKNPKNFLRWKTKPKTTDTGGPSRPPVGRPREFQEPSQKGRPWTGRHARPPNPTKTLTAPTPDAEQQPHILAAARWPVLK